MQLPGNFAPYVKLFTLSLRIWLFTNLLFGVCLVVFVVLSNMIRPAYLFIPVVVSFIGSLPAVLIIFIALHVIAKYPVPFYRKKQFLLLVRLAFCLMYGMAAFALAGFDEEISLYIGILLTGLLA